MFYEHDDDDYILLKIILRDVVGKYNVYRDKDNAKGGKGMGFKLDDDSLTKVYNIFVHIEEKKGIAINDFTYENKGEEYLKTKVNDETCFREDGKSIVNPNENIKYTCRVLLKVQSICFNMKDNNDEDIVLKCY